MMGMNKTQVPINAASEEVELAWKALCLAAHSRFTALNKVPLSCFFQSGSAWADACADYDRAWKELYTKIGDVFWGDLGFDVDWADSHGKDTLTLIPRTLQKPTESLNGT